MDVGIVILSPDRNIGGLKNTLGSVRHHTYNRESVCAVADDASAAELRDMRQLCETHTGGNTITSLINVGMKKLKHDWAFIVFNGSRLVPYVERRFESWARQEGDVLFPVVDRKCDFVSGSFNGVLINTRFFAKVGDFPTGDLQKQGSNDFELAKMFWAMQAVQHGCTFKGIVGMRII